MKIFIVLVVCLLIGVNASASDCDINLKPGVTYQDLNIAFSCLVNKIEALEKEVKILKRSGGNPPSNEKGPTLLENKYFSVSRYKISKTKDSVLLSFIVTSKNDADLWIAVLRASPLLVDGSGKSFHWDTLDGVKLHDYANNTKQVDYTVLTPGSSMPISMVFKVDKFNGDGVDFRVTLLQLIGDKILQYSIGKSGIILE